MAATTLPAPTFDRAVPVATAQTTAVRAERSLGHYLVLGVVLTTILLGLGVGLPIWIAYGNLWAAAGIGGMAAMWGGPCFGLIAGAATYTLHTEH